MSCICFVCGKEIDRFLYDEYHLYIGSFDKNANQDRLNERQGVLLKNFRCPHCQKFITNEVSVAYDLLNGKEAKGYARPLL